MPKCSKKKSIYKKRKLSKKKKFFGGKPTNSSANLVADKELAGMNKENNNKQLADNIGDSIIQTAHDITPTVTKTADNIGTAVNELYDQTKDIAAAGIVSLSNSLSDVTGIDLSDKKKTSKELNDIVDTLSSDELKEALSEGATVINEVAQEMQPKLSETSDIVIEESEKIGSKSLKALIQVMLNGMEEIFPFGPIIALSRSANITGKTIIENFDHVNNIVEQSTDLTSTTLTNLNDALNDDSENVENKIEDRAQDQQKKFINSDQTEERGKKNSKEIEEERGKKNSKEIEEKSKSKKGGTRNAKKKKKHKSKTVRFQL